MIVHMVLEKKEGRFAAACGASFTAKSPTDRPTGFASSVSCRACLVAMRARTEGVRQSLTGTPPPQAELFPERRVES